MLYNKRIENLRRLMVKENLDGILLISDVNRNYMSGFTGNESYSIITANKAIFITDSRYTEQAKIETKDYEVIEYKGAFVDFLSDLVKNLNIKKLGFEDNIISYSTYNTYKNKLVSALIPIGNMIEEIRIIKDEVEIQCIRDAAEIADKAFTHMLSFIKLGMTEREVGLELEFFMKRNGATDLSFPSIVASGVRSSLPHGEATEKTIKNGEFLTLDFGCIYKDYCSDMTRTIVIGDPDDKMIDIYNVVLTAQKTALSYIKPGITGIDLDSVARNIIKESGYGDYFGHGLGHGVGREIHEAPYISFKGKHTLKKGMIITDEPGVYIPGFGGVRIEDLICVTDNGYEVISKSPKDLICI